MKASDNTASVRAASTDIATFPSWPTYEDDEVLAVRQVLESGRVNYWTGVECREFEKEYASNIGVAWGLALANGTVSLELALAVLGIGAGDEVVTSPRTFIASASCAVMRGAKPIFADVDRDSQNITASSIERVLTSRTKAIIPVHLAGWPCDMDPIMDLARSRGLAVIEDCAQAHGASYRGHPVGGIGHFGSFSFCQDKIISTGGEGGMLVMSDKDAWKKAWAYKDHGKGFDAVYSESHAPGFRWLHRSFGTNWRLTEMQAAIGRIQLRKLESWRDKRKANALFLSDRLGKLGGLRVPIPPAEIEHAYYRFYVFVEPEKLRSNWSRDVIIEEISKLGVPCFVGSCSEIYMEAAFEHAGTRPQNRLPIARELGETSLAFPVHPTLQAEHMERTASAVETVLRRAVR